MCQSCWFPTILFHDNASILELWTHLLRCFLGTGLRLRCPDHSAAHHVTLVSSSSQSNISGWFIHSLSSQFLKQLRPKWPSDLVIVFCLASMISYQMLASDYLEMQPHIIVLLYIYWNCKLTWLTCTRLLWSSDQLPAADWSTGFRPLSLVSLLVHKYFHIGIYTSCTQDIVTLQWISIKWWSQIGQGVFSHGLCNRLLYWSHNGTGNSARRPSDLITVRWSLK